MLFPRFGLDIAPAIQSLDWQASVVVASIALGKGVEFGSTKSNVLVPVCIEQFLLVSDGMKDIFSYAPVAFEEGSQLGPGNANNAGGISPITYASFIDASYYLLVATLG